MKLDQKAAPTEHVYELLDCRAVDGDTIEARVDLGFSVLTIQRFRLKGFYAPELDGGMPDQGRAARDVLQAVLARSRCTVKRRGMRKDNCGRYLITLLLDGVAADPFLVLYPYQMTEANHAADLRAQKANKGRVPSQP